MVSYRNCKTIEALGLTAASKQDLLFGRGINRHASKNSAAQPEFFQAMDRLGPG